MGETITAIQVLDALNAAVKQAGENTTRKCSYAVYGSEEKVYDEVDRFNEETPVAPHCIAGTVLFNLGVPLEALVDFEGTNVSAMENAQTGTGYKKPLPVVLEFNAWRLLESAQSAQDAHNPWGYALEEAKHEARTQGVLED